MKKSLPLFEASQLSFDKTDKKQEPNIEEDKKPTSSATSHFFDEEVSSHESDESQGGFVEKQAYSVSYLNQLIKGLIENEFHDVYVRGEISNFTAHSSGHFYFRLKDENSQIQAVMFRGQGRNLKFRPQDGLEVLVKARVSVYEPRGNYQIICETMEPLGAGALRLAFDQLKEKLQKEGLFERSRKKPLPLWPKHIAIVTSPTGAAIRDILQILNRRAFDLKVTVIPALVQGEGSSQSLIKALALADSLNPCVLICGRGGGSIEDLWSFNEEAVVRALAACEAPTISAVGHEIDHTICDFVADLRAPTPSAAAELVVQDKKDVKLRVEGLEKRLLKSWEKTESFFKQRLVFCHSHLTDPRKLLEDRILYCDDLTRDLKKSILRSLDFQKEKVEKFKLRLINPRDQVHHHKQKLDHLGKLLEQSMRASLKEKKLKLQENMKSLDNLSPLSVLSRGYSLTYKKDKVITKASELKENDEISLQFSEGEAKARIEYVKKRNKFEK